MTIYAFAAFGYVVFVCWMFEMGWWLGIVYDAWRVFAESDKAIARIIAAYGRGPATPPTGGTQ